MAVPRPLLAAPVSLLLLSGCDLLSEWLSEFDGDLETRTGSFDTESGRADINIDIEGQEAFQLTATTDQLIAVESVTAPDGDQVMYWNDWYGEESLTGAIWLEGGDTVLNWPVRAQDAPLTEGTWIVQVGVVDSNGYYTDDTVDVVTKIKEDSDLDNGTVTARIVYAQDLDQDATVTQGVDDAIDRWAEVWADYGLTLETTTESSSFDTDMSFPGEDPEHDQVADGADGSEVTILVGETIDGATDYYGVAGSIPGTLDHTSRALVIVSWLTNAGTDGEFSDEDIRLFGETLAHEVGHYMGLFHPVEIEWQYWDALSDTDQCSTQSGCESNLGDNLMYPYPVCSFTSCTAQDQLTTSQVGVAHRYTGTL